MAGDEGLEVGADTDGAHARPTATMRDAERLVQVHVRYIGADVRRPRQPDLGIEVGAVHVHLAAVLMHHVADLADALFVHAVGRRVGDHQARQPIPGSLGLGLQVSEVDVALLVALDDDHLHAGHLRRGRVGAVGRRWNEAQCALGLMPAVVIAGDGHEAGVFTLGTRVGLHADGIETGNGAQPSLQLVDHRLVAHGLAGWGEGVELGEAGPGDRDHLAGGVEFHGARAQRDHRLVQRQVLVLQLLEITQHLGFAVMQVEHRVREEWRAAHQALGNGLRQGQLIQRIDFQTMVDPEENVEQAQHRLFTTGFIQAHAQMTASKDAQVDACVLGAFDDGRLGTADVQRQGIEEVLVEALDALGFKAGSQDAGQPMHALGDAAQAFGAVVDGVEAGDVGQQHLRRADVGVGLLAADVLLSGLQRHAQRSIAAGVA
ncbi:hypothetical protein D3C79_638220 [compost metagenome]